jgi:hypothetical protein
MTDDAPVSSALKQQRATLDSCGVQGARALGQVIENGSRGPHYTFYIAAVSLAWRSLIRTRHEEETDHQTSGQKSAAPAGDR